jgi:ubiquinone/menaquinone biosynthesis C-methylase UbiE
MKQKNDSRFWDSFAKKYDKFIIKHVNKTYTSLIQLINSELSTEFKVLEIGTGTGIISLSIANKVKNIVAIDYAPEMIKIANIKLEESNLTNIEFKVNSATNIEYPNKYFDLIIASNIFHLLPEPEKALHEIIRLLTNNGKVILPTYCHGQNLKTRFISTMMSITGFKAINKWSLKEYREFIEQEGLKIKKEEIIRDKIPLSFIVVSKQLNHG